MANALKLAVLCALVLTVAACSPQRRPSDAELGLNSTQAAGRRIFDRQCGYCHEAYSSKGTKGPSLQGVFKRPYLHMGAPANDERVSEIIMVGRAKMPGYARVLNQQQLADLIAYLKTL